MMNASSGLYDRRIWIGLLFLAVIIGAVFFIIQDIASDSDQDLRPELLVMSSIPLQWGDATMAQIASGEAEPSPLFKTLSASNTLTLIDDVHRLGKSGKAPLLLVQPRALAPTELVVLDDWVRKGGTAIVFADPALDWPSDMPLGDQRRPLFTSLLNPLFRHWGVELALPVADEEAVVATTVGKYAISLKSPGIWVLPKNSKATARCNIRKDERMAVCAVGKGKALLVADADMLQEALWTDTVLTSGTMAWVQDVIASSRSKVSYPETLWEIQGN